MITLLVLRTTTFLDRKPIVATGVLASRDYEKEKEKFKRTGPTDFSGNAIWTDGDNIYYSNSRIHYVLDKATSTWYPKSWSGHTTFYGDKIWTDGDNIYYSNFSDQYVLDKAFSVKCKPTLSS